MAVGRPVAATDMLQTDDHQITLLFQSRISISEKKPMILRVFKAGFSWLISANVSSPPSSQSFLQR